MTPGDEILYSCLTKATTGDSDDFRRSASWVTARRAMLYVTPRELRCGDWTIPLEQIRDALLFSFRGRFFRTAYVLRVDTGVTKYQFGLNGNAFWEGELPFPVRREHGRIGYSPLSVAARAVVLGYLAYRAWRWFA